MTPKEIRDAIRSDLDRIRQNAGDPEAAHSYEDVLHRRVLSAIANGLLTGDDAKQCAAMALLTSHINFERWYA